MKALPKLAVITGASSGIGESFARELANLKVNLILVARRKERLEKLAQELRNSFSIHVTCLAIDVTNPSELQSLFDHVERSGKPVDFLINNAGTGIYRNFLDADLGPELNLIDLNLSSLVRMTHFFGRHMRAHSHRSYILNVASIAAYQNMPKFAVYCASKFAVRVFSRILNAELQGTGISVTCLCPGGTRTEFLDQAGQAPTGNFSERYLFMDAADVAQIGVRGALAGKALVIPGWFNKIACALPRFVPEWCSLWLAKRSMEIAVREN